MFHCMVTSDLIFINQNLTSRMLKKRQFPFSKGYVEQMKYTYGCSRHTYLNLYNKPNILIIWDIPEKNEMSDF